MNHLKAKPGDILSSRVIMRKSLDGKWNPPWLRMSVVREVTAIDHSDDPPPKDSGPIPLIF